MHGELGPGADTKRARMLRGVTLRHRDWLAARRDAPRMRWKWHEFFKEYDLLLCPPRGRGGDAARPQGGAYDREIVIDGQVLSLPRPDVLVRVLGRRLPPGVGRAGRVHAVGGLPVGVQIVGPQYGDRTVHRVRPSPRARVPGLHATGWLFIAFEGGADGPSSLPPRYVGGGLDGPLRASPKNGLRRRSRRSNGAISIPCDGWPARSSRCEWISGACRSFPSGVRWLRRPGGARTARGPARLPRGGGRSP